ncbi:phage antirepressor KilAC domain-containing protein [Limosilactobacillus sp. WF-MT5-A]|uniref:Rha family transcriptional regulator n=1 Tax=Limosilactobacillus agrestis TaxID=2759748 RepID=UPI0015F96322|nr:phage regulatory protein/antirepressor Ant [Limosilactobacillus agrestis]MBB1100008.1 phage antirepressor KilAC domain-containing protein [Limosilactobacillus agrestis]MCD7127408.1 phage regulatory protein/antirepressor Ant [Limosilactobacillus agrestis]
MNEPKLLDFRGEPTLDSREVAKMIGKRHRDLMRDIRRYINDMDEGAKLRSPKFFIESNYESSQGKLLPCYLLTKMGCEFVANKMTGRKGTLFTAQYVSLFNEYQASLKKPDSYTIDDPVKRAERWIEERKAYEALVPKGQYFDSQMHNPGLMTVTEIAKDYGMTATKLNRLLHEFGVQFKQGRHWVLYHKYDGKGYTQYEAFAYNDNKGVHNNLKWTQRGRKFIYDVLKDHGILPVLEQSELLPDEVAVN